VLDYFLVLYLHGCCIIVTREVSLVRLRLVWMTNHPPSVLGWVIRPVKTVGHITYIVLVQALNHAQSIKPSP